MIWKQIGKKVGKKIALAVALCGVAGAAGAVGNIADVTVYDRAEGRSLPVYRHEGRYYVVGRPGNEYQIRVQNRSGGDVLAVMSVDGVNAISGETANWNQSGYVLTPGVSYDIRGWRKSLERIAAFFFTEHQNSYAARTGRPDNVGVIGVALFRRKAEPEARIDQAPPRERPWYGARDDSSYRSNAGSNAGSPAGSSAPAAPESKAESLAGDAAGAARSQEGSADMQRREPSVRRSPSLGTGHGRSEASRVSYTNFERATPEPEEVVAIRYDTYNNLVALGVIRAPRVASPAPSPFPGQFAPDPRW
ncbi:MAG TPA: hypothetical protein VJQ51_02245 [Burkholderiales bacterium]|nr:hypothetical protein [Burkholderiales bacterium]